MKQLASLLTRLRDNETLAGLVLLALACQCLLYLLLVGLILSLGIAILGFGNDRLVPVVHFNLAISHVLVNRGDLQVVHGLFEVSHRLLILLEVDDEIVGPLPLQYAAPEVLHVV